MKKPAKRPAHLTKAFKKGLEHSNSRAPGIRREICLSYRNTGAIDFEKVRGYDSGVEIRNLFSDKKDPHFREMLPDALRQADTGGGVLQGTALAANQ